MLERCKGRHGGLPLLLLLALAAACGKPETVSVSGAVTNPGSLPYRTSWSTRDYVSAAGGLQPEADTLAAELIRMIPDTTGAEEESLLMTRFPLADVTGVLPDDEIWVPRRRYPVRMDSVYVVADLEIEWRGRVYRLADGRLIPGRTDRGVLAAVVLGDGEVSDKVGSELLGRFHYLYLRTGPAAFEGILGHEGQLVRDPEALEDAVALHQTLSGRLGDPEDGTIEMPGADALRILAGQWPRPRSTMMPGSGIRKRRYEDGREWTTFPDGRQRVKHKDGLVVVNFPDGGTETRWPDGSRERRTAAGLVQTVSVEGVVVTVNPGGIRETRYPDGRLEQRFPTGTVRTVTSDGVERTVFRDGTVKVTHPDGRLVAVAPDGSRETRYGDGRKEAVTADGHRVRVEATGHRVSEMADGSRVEEFPDGRKIQVRPSGERLEVSADGSRRTLFPDGSETITRADGSRFERHTDGTTIEVFTDGREVQRNPDGVVIETLPDGRRIQTDTAGNLLESFPDGRRVQTDRFGNRAESLADGVRVRTFIDGYRYWGEPKTDLVRLDAIPESLAVGRDLVLTGSVPEGVDGIWAGLFRLPDGLVRTAPIVFSDRSFSCAFVDTLRPEGPGHYRLQVMAHMGKEGIVAADLPLVVGCPDDLGEMTLAILPFRSPERSGERARLLINRARRRAGLDELQRDENLDRAADDLLWHGALGGVSDGVAFGGENMGSGPSVEEVLGYMMMSANQRRHILSRRWTRVGVSVVREGDKVRVAQVFEGDGD